MSPASRPARSASTARSASAALVTSPVNAGPAFPGPANVTPSGPTFEVPSGWANVAVAESVETAPLVTRTSGSASSIWTISSWLVASCVVFDSSARAMFVSCRPSANGASETVTLKTRWMTVCASPGSS